MISFSKETLHLHFADGDVIFVGRRKSSITVQGAVHNSYQFEFNGQFLTGADAVEFAHPHTNATNVSIRTDSRESGHPSICL